VIIQTRNEVEGALRVPQWEYGQLVLSRRPAKNPHDEWPVRSAFHAGKASDPQQLDGADPLQLLNRLGRDGWELVGPPDVANTVTTFVDLAGATRERVDWLERRFWLKRLRTA
jgi:hypothetical protein